MLSGRRVRELGSHPRYLDILGLNFYYDNRWVYPDGRPPWETMPRDLRRRLLHRLLGQINLRYRRPMIVVETWHFDDRRGRWLPVANEMDLAQT